MLIDKLKRVIEKPVETFDWLFAFGSEFKMSGWNKRQIKGVLAGELSHSPVKHLVTHKTSSHS
ncbi:hypothetical protein VCHA43P273_20245 [Vibrio chagasii]|nr:hypothetical protein VCHA32P90_40122 [Vibrio chagasii]CAH6985582.1 hypothetical protein VCHA35O137_50099 [Vibrio chagasii]CAH7072673.1 hypothetical protein VCHA34P116_90096 [Vibrio chagasii]CAH7187312.1 hypothetical protein VCHA43P273_20245 [Vibrio chagasii]CAH7292128.1 hypothetical protein VCHA53O469_40122 [Vibrio chagasii]